MPTVPIPLAYQSAGTREERLKPLMPCLLLVFFARVASTERCQCGRRSSSPSPLHARYSEGATAAQHALQAPLAMELIAELQVMDEKAQTDVRFITVMDGLSHTES
jgi:hypothetical protein